MIRPRTPHRTTAPLRSTRRCAALVIAAGILLGGGSPALAIGVDVTITPSPSAPAPSASTDQAGGLPATGADPMPYIGLGVMTIAAGLAVAGARRRRRSTGEL